MTTCDVSASPEAVICQIHAKEMIRLSDDGSDIYIKYNGWSRWLLIILIHAWDRSRQRHMRWYSRGMKIEVALG